MPIGVDIIEPPMMFELEKAGLKVKDGQQVMLEAREVKSADEIALLNRAAAMVDGAYHLINEKLKPGVRENDIVAEVNKFLYTHGSDDVEAVNAISGERCNPHPHNFTDRMIRPGDQAFFDILQSFMGYRTCYYRTFNVGRATPCAARRLQEGARVARQRHRADQARRLDRAHLRGVPEGGQSSASRTNCRRSACNSRHGLGLALHERPIISRVVSMDHPTEIKEGMVFAIETYCPATDGYSAARIEEEVVVTDKGCTRDLAVPGRGTADRGEILMMRTCAALSNANRVEFERASKPIGQGTSVKNTSNIRSRSLLCAAAGVLAVLMVAGGDQARRGPGLRCGGALHPGRDAAVQRVRPRRRPHRRLPQGQAEAVDAGVPGALSAGGGTQKAKKHRARRHKA